MSLKSLTSNTRLKKRKRKEAKQTSGDDYQRRMREALVFFCFCCRFKEQTGPLLNILPMFEQISQLSLFLRLTAKLELTEALIVDLSFRCDPSSNPVERRPWRRGLLPFRSHSHTVLFLACLNLSPSDSEEHENGAAIIVNSALAFFSPFGLTRPPRETTWVCVCVSVCVSVCLYSLA